METIMFLMVFKKGEIVGCATVSVINVDGIIPTPMCCILSAIVIQALYVFRFITTIVSCKSLLPIMILLADILDE